MEKLPYRERARWELSALGQVCLGLGVSTSQLTLGRSPTRGGAAAHVGQVYLTCPGRDVRVPRGARRGLCAVAEAAIWGTRGLDAQVDKPMPRRGEPNLEYGAVRCFSFLRPGCSRRAQDVPPGGAFSSLIVERRACAGERVGWLGRRSNRNQNGGTTVL